MDDGGKVGFTLPQRGVFFGVTSVAEMLTLATKADASPFFGSVWVGDSLGAKPRPDSLTLLGALASVTKRVRLGVGCMASFPVRDPLVFAYQWATLDLISNGRMLLAACTGLVAGGASAREGAAYHVADRERARDRRLRRLPEPRGQARGELTHRGAVLRRGEAPHHGHDATQSRPAAGHCGKPQFAHEVHQAARSTGGHGLTTRHRES